MAERRVSVAVEGTVQGVGFRPFVYRLATSLGLAGQVSNGPDGVHLEVEGPAAAIDQFLAALREAPPPQARIERFEVAETSPRGECGFRIVESEGDAAPRPALPADLATCPDCAAEIASASERRHRYPFTNCTNCGPRYSIVESLPYDRPRTSMRGFPMCPDCETEYRDPADRRFHAQPIACPRCGPQLELRGRDGASLARGDAALTAAARAVRDGRILALKGLGGFQLLADAMNADAVACLRHRKHREQKPFAVMFPTLQSLKAMSDLKPDEERALLSPQAPILLVRRRPHGPALAPGVAPGNPRIGAMLPYSPLHKLLLGEIAGPVICTSGNQSDEPMCTDEADAYARLGGIADLFLVHDRPIVRPVDDSVARMGPDGLQLLRRARGFAPLPLPLAHDGPTVLALGGQLKGAVGIALGRQAILSQHLGDLDSAEGAALLERTVDDLLAFFRAKPEVVACDLHPDYTSTLLAERLSERWSVPLVRVQHHHAHAAACLAEHGLDRPALALTWDGTGWGQDGSIWGGEALLCVGAEYERVGWLRRFLLPGGDLAAREPRRSMLGLLHAVDPALAAAHGERMFAPPELHALLGMLDRGVGCAPTSSMGRLFDAVSALLGVRDRNGFEGQAAMELEFAAEGHEAAEGYPLPLAWDGAVELEPLVRGILRDRERGGPPGLISARFHQSLADLAAALGRRSGVRRAVLTGGCFQNERLTRLVRAALERSGFEVFTHRQVPPNDGGIALGQLAIARARRAA